MEGSERLEELTVSPQQPTWWKGKRLRAWHPFSTPDGTLPEVISRGEWSVPGFHKWDLQALLVHHLPPRWKRSAGLGPGQPLSPPAARPSPDPESSA